MCNLYALTKGQQALRDLARALELGPVRDDLGNLPSLPALYPDSEAPIIGIGAQAGEVTGPILKLARWGMPSPAFALEGKSVDRGVTNIRNTASPHEAAETPPCFAGLATRWTGTRKKAEGEVTLTLFGFLTCPPNADVAPHHPKAMPVVLTELDEMRAWLTADWADAAVLQRPLPDGALVVLGFEGEG